MSLWQTFFPVLKQVEINHIFPDDVYVLCLNCYVVYAKQKLNLHTERQKWWSFWIDFLLGVYSAVLSLTNDYYTSLYIRCRILGDFIRLVDL